MSSFWKTILNLYHDTIQLVYCSLSVCTTKGPPPDDAPGLSCPISVLTDRIAHLVLPAYELTPLSGGQKNACGDSKRARERE